MPTQSNERNSPSEQEKPWLGLPFCGLGDIECLTSRLLSCGFSLIELPLPTCGNRMAGAPRS